MPYKTSYLTRFERDVKAFKKNKSMKNLIFEQVKAIVENPGIGKALVANLDGLYNVGFGDHREYRLLYRMYACCQRPNEITECPVADPLVSDNECEGVVSFIFIKTREECNNLYRKKKAYFDETLTEGLPPI